MTKSELFLFGAGVAACVTAVSIIVAAIVSPAIIPVLTIVGTALSIMLAHELVKAACVRAFKYIVKPTPVPIVVVKKLRNKKPHTTQTLRFSRTYSEVDINGKHTSYIINTQMQSDVEHEEKGSEDSSGAYETTIEKSDTPRTLTID